MITKLYKVYQSWSTSFIPKLLCLQNYSKALKAKMAAMALNLAGLGKSVLQSRGMDTTVDITIFIEEHLR